MFRKGTILVRRPPSVDPSTTSQGHLEGGNPFAIESQPKAKRKDAYEGITGEIEVLHEDIIGDAFWTARPWLLNA